MNPEVRKIAAERDTLARKLAALILEFENTHGLTTDNITVRRVTVTNAVGHKRRQLSVLLSCRIPETDLPPMVLAPSDDPLEDGF